MLIAIEKNQIYGFENLGLNKIYAFTEVDNKKALRLDLRRGFIVEGILNQDLFSDGKFVDRYSLGVYKDMYLMPQDIYFEEV